MIVAVLPVGEQLLQEERAFVVRARLTLLGDVTIVNTEKMNEIENETAVGFDVQWTVQRLETEGQSPERGDATPIDECDILLAVGQQRTRVKLLVDVRLARNVISVHFGIEPRRLIAFLASIEVDHVVGRVLHGRRIIDEQNTLRRWLRFVHEKY